MERNIIKILCILKMNEFNLKCSLNYYPDVRTNVLQCENTNFPSNTLHTVWTSSENWTLLSSAQTLYVSSTDINDTINGSGARVIRIDGLDNSRKEISETLMLNGTDDVITTNQFLIVHRCMVVAAGSEKSNKGHINLRTETGLLQGHIYQNKSLSKHGFFMCPADRKMMIITRHYIAENLTNNNSIVEFKINGYQAIRNVDYEIGHSFINTSIETEHNIMLPFNEWLSEGTVISINAKSNNGGEFVAAMLHIIESL